MAAETNTDPAYAEVDRALAIWRQGDCVLGEHWFAHRIDLSLPATAVGRTAAEADSDLAEEEVEGLIIVTQTCDIVRNCIERPYVEVCPLVEVSEGNLREIERGQRPAYAFIPLLAARRLVAHLDRVMTVEKPVVARWERTPGWSSDAEGREFAQALARKRARLAAPEDFVELVKKLQSRLSKKHNRNSDEGRALRALREIRVQASPSWNDDPVALMFWFVRKEEDPDFEEKDWSILLDGWLKLVPPTGRFTKVYGVVVTLEDMTAADYVNSDLLDLDHLSSPRDPR